MLDLVEGEQLLLLRQDLLDKVLVQHLIRWHIELETLREVLDEVALRTELPDEFMCHHPPLLCASEDLILFNHVIYLTIILMSWPKSY